MKIYPSIMLFFISTLISCNNSNELKKTIEVNNVSLIKEIEEFRFMQIQRHNDQPTRFDSVFVAKTELLINNIIKFKNIENYNNLIFGIKKISKLHKIPTNVEIVNSKDLLILKNNLLLNFLKYAKMFDIKSSEFESTHCFFGPIVKSDIIKSGDSVYINFNTINPYSIILDSIVHNKKKLNFKFEKKYTIGCLKFKTTKEFPNVFGKIFYTDYFGKSIMIQEFQ